MAKYDVYVVGMRRELIVDAGPGSEAFDTELMENEQFVLFCITAEGRVKFTITLRTDYGWCGSGYTTATQGIMQLKRVSDFGPATHMVKDRKVKIAGATYDASKNSLWEALIFETDESSVDEDYYRYRDDDAIVNNVFTFSSTGDDDYYPMGGVSVELELFVELKRAFKERPVWIFSGASGSGKSTIGYILETNGDKLVYETDSANNGRLPKTIWADVVVVGNKWKDITPEVVKEHLPEGCKPVDVAFSMD